MRRLLQSLVRTLASLSRPLWAIVGLVGAIVLIWIPPVSMRLAVGSMFAVKGLWPAWYFRRLHRVENGGTN